MKTLYFKKGQEIVQEGQLSECAYILEWGTVEVSKIDPSGKKQVLDVLYKNDIFGEMGLIDGLPRSATVTAVEDCTVSVLSKDTFKSLATNNPEALMPILRVLARRLRGTLDLISKYEAGASKKRKSDSNYQTPASLAT